MLQLSSFTESSMLLARSQEQGVDCYHFSFSSLSQLRDFLLLAGQQNLSVIPGRPRELPPGAALKQAAFVDLDGMAAVVEHQRDDQVIGVQSGIKLSALHDYLQKHQQRWPVGWHAAETTVFDLVNAGRYGPLEQGFGNLADLVLGLDVMLTNGEIITCGGKVVKNVTGYDLTRLMVGAAGTLGIVTQANLRLQADYSTACTLYFEGHSIAQLITLSRRVLSRGWPISALQIVDSRLLPMPFTQVANVLLLLIQGQPLQVEELSRQLADSLKNSATATVLEPAAADQIWYQLALPVANFSMVEITGALEHLEGLISAGIAADCAGWQLSPGFSHLQICLQRKAELAALLSMVKVYAEQNNCVLEVAASNEKYSYMVQRLPACDANQQELKARLKQRFDPQNILNPLVLL